VSKKAFALRIDEQILDAMQRWADDDLRSLNAQIEWALREGLRRAGRLPSPPSLPEQNEATDSDTEDGIKR